MRRMPDLVRFVYRDLVKRRTEVRVVEMTEGASMPAPVFVISPYRSGTTVLRLVLDSHSGLAVPGETTFISHFQRMLSDVKCMAGFQALGLDPEGVKRQMSVFVGRQYSNFAYSVGKSRWGDKSPEYVWHWRLIREMFPDAKFIVLVRHVADQVGSHLRSSHNLGERLASFIQEQDQGFEPAAARYWSAASREQICLLESYPDNSTLLRYEDLVADPAKSMERIFNFLELPWEPQVLDFGNFDHPYGLSDSRARETRTIEPRLAQDYDWRQGSRDEVAAIARHELDYFGY